MLSPPGFGNSWTTAPRVFGEHASAHKDRGLSSASVSWINPLTIATDQPWGGLPPAEVLHVQMQKKTLQTSQLLSDGHEADSFTFDGERNLQSSIAELLGGIYPSASASTTSGRSEVSCETPPSEQSDNIVGVDVHGQGQGHFQRTRPSLGFSTAAPWQPTYLEKELAPDPELVPLNNKWMKSAFQMPNNLADDADMAAARLMACGTTEVSSHEATCTKQPCIFALRHEGCKNGENCNFCHICASTKEKDTVRANRMRPCKGKRERYRKLVEKLKQSAIIDPEFDFDTQKLPPSIESNEWVKSKLEKAVRRSFGSKEVPQHGSNTDGAGTGTSVIELLGLAVSV